MRRPDVDRMMASMSARVYSEWEAYERATGPLDSAYEREMMAQLHELIQLNNLLTGAQVTKKGKKNPAGKFQKVRRPEDIWFPPDDEPEDDPDEDEDDEYIDGEFVEDYDDYDDEDEVEVADPNAYDPSKDPFA
jgi:hypothetical protein